MRRRASPDGSDFHCCRSGLVVHDAFFRFVIDMGRARPGPHPTPGLQRRPQSARRRSRGRGQWPEVFRRQVRRLRELADPARVPGGWKARRRHGHVQEWPEGLSAGAGRQGAGHEVHQRIQHPGRSSTRSTRTTISFARIITQPPIAVANSRKFCRAISHLLFRDRRCNAGEKRVVIDLFEKEGGSSGGHRPRTD